MTVDEWLYSRFEPIDPMEFYGEIFGDDLEVEGEYTEGKYAAIAVELPFAKYPDGRPVVYRHSVFDGLDKLDELMCSENFVVIAPITYAGKSRKSVNARYMYALCIELDHIRFDDNHYPAGLGNLFAQVNKAKIIPRPTYIVSSGSGVHLYYAFESPVPMFRNVAQSIERLKRELTTKIWNGYNTYDEERVQYESIFQAFRLVGGITKKGGRTTAYRTGDKVTLEYLNGFVQPENRASVVYKSALPLAEARKKYPEWYQRRVVEGKPKGTWTCNRAVYDWWLRRITTEAKVGHRYYCMMTLAIYAVKCDIAREELEKNCYDLLDKYESLTENDDNHFTVKDVADALQVYDDKGYHTYPVNSIANRSGLFIEKNKRNGRKQADHVRLMNFIRDEINQNSDWRNKAGRPVGSGIKKNIVKEWREQRPDGRKADCIKETGLAKATVYKWWDS